MKCGCDAYTCWLRDAGLDHETYERHISEDWEWIRTDSYWHPEWEE